MKKQIVSLLMSSVLMLSIAAVASTDSANASVNNVDLKSKAGNEIISPYSIGDTLTWDLNGNKTDPATSYSVSVGYPNIKLYAKNTGTQSYRVEVKHNSKNTVIFNTYVPAGQTLEVVNNDSIPLVPSGTYTVTIYGGSGQPKGQVILKSSDTRWN